MTTISPKRKRNAARLQLISLLVLIFAVVGVVTLVRGPLTSLLWRAGSPLAQVSDAWTSKLNTLFSSFQGNYQLALENKQLQDALASSSVLLLDRQVLYSENLELKNRLGRVPPNMTSILGNVINRPPGTPYDTLMIDIGKRDGVSEGDLVSAGGSVYIGVITEVYTNTSRVVLFSAPGEAHAATLLQESATTSLAISVEGQGGGSLKAQVPQGVIVEIGDEVLFPSLVPEFVALVVAVEEKSQASFKTIYLQLPVNIYSLKHVEVRRIAPTRL
ncbi:MAG: Uncharacterized protein G01um101456_129 [Parcubacteria group bacterium Gr01-1014_56]|nr:MAG: Uncharacterized protein G01um101456_129 [Parcubacteria group bacterium Gr01-1014_56]